MLRTFRRVPANPIGGEGRTQCDGGTALGFLDRPRGTFTDVVGGDPTARCTAEKLLSESPNFTRMRRSKRSVDLLGLAAGGADPPRRGSAPSRWAPRSRPTRCSSAAATAPGSSPRRLPRRARDRLPGAAQYLRLAHRQARACLFERASRSPSACGRRHGRGPPDLAAVRARSRARSADGTSVAIVSCTPITIPRMSAAATLVRAAWPPQVSVSHASRR